MNKVIGTPKEHHDCKGKYPSWETASHGQRSVSWCYGCGRTWYQDTGEEAHLHDLKEIKIKHKHKHKLSV